MEKSNPSKQEVVGDQAIEDIKHKYSYAPGEGAGSCHVCGQDVAEGMEVGVVAFRRAASPAFEVQYVLCSEHLDEHATAFTLGVREVVVQGRFGWCSFGERGLCSVVVSPSIVGVSEASTTSMREVPDDTGVTVDLGGRLACERESGEGQVVPEMRVVMELPVECRVEEPTAGPDENEVSGDGE
jgi:hypothetical protein